MSKPYTCPQCGPTEHTADCHAVTYHELPLRSCICTPAPSNGGDELSDHIDELNAIFKEFLRHEDGWDEANSAIRLWAARLRLQDRNALVELAERMYYSNHVGSVEAVPVDAIRDYYEPKPGGTIE